MAMLYTFLTLCLFAGTIAYYPDCKAIRAQMDFELGQFEGMWYIWGAYVNGSNPFNDTCGSIVFTKVNRFQLEVIEYMVQEPYQIKANITRMALITDPNTQNRFMIRYGPGYEQDEVVVFATDYLSYAIVFRCPQRGNIGRMVLIYTKRQKPSEETVTRFTKKLTDAKVTDWKLFNMKHSDCEPLPFC